jgi:hypothetical protein
MRRYALRDDQWDRIKDILLGHEGHVGVTAKDNRLFVEAAIYRYRPASLGETCPNASATRSRYNHQKGVEGIRVHRSSPCKKLIGQRQTIDLSDGWKMANAAESVAAARFRGPDQR